MREALKRVIPADARRFIRERVLPSRANVAEARLFAERHWLAGAGRRRARRSGRILCYHSIGQPEYGVNDVAPERFRRHLDLALAAGYRFVAPSQIARTGGGPKELAISFDDGLKSVLTNAAPILEERGIPFAVFPVSNWSDMKPAWCPERVLTWGELELLLKRGAELGSHSVSHPDFAKIGHQQRLDELAQSRDVIRQRLGFAPESFAIPFGQSGNWPEPCAEAARRAGYSIVYAQAEETRPKGTVPRTFVTKHDSDRVFKAVLAGKYDRWEEWF
jgi:peptidoglycan/xylan/chitin deacetylase (PgdA/CDA1 family)